MSHDNGHKPTLACKAPNTIPIIGQPFTVRGWFPTVLLVCNCDAHEPVMIPRGAAAQCPGCKKLYTIQQLAFTPEGNVNFGIGIMTPEAAAEMAHSEEGSIHG